MCENICKGRKKKGEAGWAGGRERETVRETMREDLECFAVRAILKASPHFGFTTKLHSVKGNYHYPHFRNDEREAAVLCG